MTKLEDSLALALRCVRKGDWHGAHEIVQRHEGEPRADWIHAVLHRVEGDLGNARYWYRRCGRTLPKDESPETEFARIAEALDAKRRRAAGRARGSAV